MQNEIESLDDDVKNILNSIQQVRARSCIYIRISLG